MRFLPYIVIGGLLIYIFFWKGCGNDDGGKVEIHDTLYLKPDTINLPYPQLVYKYIDTGSIKFITLADTTNIDSCKRKLMQLAYQIAEHKIYFDSFENDTIKATFTDTVAQCELIGKHFTYELKLPLITNTTIISENRFKVFAGLDVGANLTGDRFSLTPNIKIVTKKDVLLEVGYDIPNQMPLLGVAIKIKFKK